MRFRHRDRGRGFTLVETMVAGTIFAIGLVAIIQGISSAQSMRRSANLRAEAVKLAQHAIDRLIPMT